jgi:heme-degrading monooxygenase HmoA
MAFVLIEHRVGDFDEFAKVFKHDEERRGSLGCRGGVVYRVADDPGNVVVVLEWETLEEARDFAGSLELEEALEWAGSDISTPRVTVLDVALESSH